MRGDDFQRLLIIVVHLELGHRFGLLGGHQRAENPLLPGQLAHQGAGVGILAQPLGEDMSGPGQRGGGIGHLFFRINERRGGLLGGAALQLLGGDQRGERFQAPLAGDGRLGPTLRLVGQIEVFQLGLLPGRIDPRLQLRRQLALLLDGLEDRDLSLLQLAEIGEALFQRADLHLVQLAGAFFPIAGDKGNGRALAEQFDGIVNLGKFKTGFLDQIAEHAGKLLGGQCHGLFLFWR